MTFAFGNIFLALSVPAGVGVVGNDSVSKMLPSMFVWGMPKCRTLLK